MTENLTRVSDKIIHYHREKYMESISPMKLQKLCYYAQGFHMAYNGTTLFDEDFEAWQHGPVIRELYNEYRAYGWKPIDKEITEGFDIESEEDNFLNEIVNSFGSYEGSTLSLMTHEETPWIDARGDLSSTESSTSPISKKSLLDYFQHQI